MLQKALKSSVAVDGKERREIYTLLIMLIIVEQMSYSAWKSQENLVLTSP